MKTTSVDHLNDVGVSRWISSVVTLSAIISVDNLNLMDVSRWIASAFTLSATTVKTETRHLTAMAL